jgi:hypothetical protein
MKIISLSTNTTIIIPSLKMEFQSHEINFKDDILYLRIPQYDLSTTIIELHIELINKEDIIQFKKLFPESTAKNSEIPDNLSAKKSKPNILSQMRNSAKNWKTASAVKEKGKVWKKRKFL